MTERQVTRGEGSPGAVVKAIVGLKAAESYVRRDFGSDKGAALEIRQAWREQRRRQRRRVVKRRGGE